MNYPLISILSSFKNDKNMLKIVMNSVLEQNYPNIEHIIFDGASTDGSVDILKEYESKYLKKGISLIWRSEKDKHTSEAYNKAAKFIQGEYFIQFSNVFVSENSLKQLAEEIIRGCYHGVAGGYIYQNNGVIIRRWSGRQLPWRLGWMCATETLLLSSSILKKYILADEYFERSSDYNLQLSLFLDPKITIKSIPTPITLFIAGGQSNGGLINNLKSIKWDYIALKKHNIFCPWFTSFGKCVMALLAYLFASKKKLPKELAKKLEL